MTEKEDLNNNNSVIFYFRGHTKGKGYSRCMLFHEYLRLKSNVWERLYSYATVYTSDGKITNFNTHLYAEAEFNTFSKIRYWEF